MTFARSCNLMALHCASKSPKLRIVGHLNKRKFLHQEMHLSLFNVFPDVAIEKWSRKKIGQFIPYFFILSIPALYEVVRSAGNFPDYTEDF